MTAWIGRIVAITMKPLLRFVSLSLALLLSSILFLFPQTVTSGGQAQHDALMLLMAGTIIGFIHGVGFKAQTLLFQLILSPILSWPIMLFGIFQGAEQAGWL